MNRDDLKNNTSIFYGNCKSNYFTSILNDEIKITNKSET